MNSGLILFSFPRVTTFLGLCLVLTLSCGIRDPDFVDYAGEASSEDCAEGLEAFNQNLSNVGTLCAEACHSGAVATAQSALAMKDDDAAFNRKQIIGSSFYDEGDSSVLPGRVQGHTGGSAFEPVGGEEAFVAWQEVEIASCQTTDE